MTQHGIAFVLAEMDHALAQGRLSHEAWVALVRGWKANLESVHRGAPITSAVRIKVAGGGGGLYAGGTGPGTGGPYGPKE